MKLFTRFLFHFIDSSQQLHGKVIASIIAPRFYAPEHLKTNKQENDLFLSRIVLIRSFWLESLLRKYFRKKSQESKHLQQGE